MTKKSKFWVGVALGAVGGLVAHKALNSSRMPNSRIWQRILAEKQGEIEAAVLMARIQKQYQELEERRPIFNRPAFNAHVVGNILPGLALYQILRGQGMDEQSALAEIDDIFEKWFNQAPPPNMRMNQAMKYFPENFDIFRRLLRFVMDQFFPAPGWQYEMIADDKHSLAFNMTHCFYLDVLNYYEAPELTPVFCKLDDILMVAMPESIKWGRTQTIGMGADCCNFRWDYVPG
ncbi:MAG: L-2-amino-thiazoline-4-carboxylic acid hydrolase [Anaerolineales bacterium]|nr:L-2-amino-thiazoline-4-carboxylic acid hydrolase [Chloroflexota bacterium]MBL6981528.1 L-2-amino-thiazoline-4-carboxylic acid hydrolase [Anaerolineales bacterium]